MSEYQVSSAKYGRFDPKIEEFLDRFSQMAAISKDLSLDESRKLSAALFTLPKNMLEPVGSVTDETIPVDGGVVPIRIFTPKKGKKPFPILLFFHQGGWVFGGIDQSEHLCRRLANNAECVVAAVGYRLAPEHPFPQGLQDCYAAVKWVAKHAERFAANPHSIGVAGASAGGNFAAALSLMFRDTKECSLALQVLFYPPLSYKIDEKKYSKNPGQRFLSSDTMKMFWELYAKDITDKQNPYASPLESQHLKDLPPSLIITAEFDPLREQAELYAKRLQQDGNTVTLKSYADVIHGFLELPIELTQKEAAIKEIGDTIQKMFAAYGKHLILKKM